MTEVKVIYDLKSVPFGITIDDVVNVQKETGYLFWDSSLGGKEPIIIDTKEEIEIIDTVKQLGKEQLDKCIQKLLNKS